MTLSIQAIQDLLRTKGVRFDDGLSATELGSVETAFGFTFPPDLREFLAVGLPISDHFPNWRTGKISWKDGHRSIADQLDWPAEGLCFDIEHNAFWMQSWGTKPADLGEAFQVARRMVKLAPQLIPVFSHRFLPADPLLEGNPVMSVYQTDIIYYGTDLPNYWANEFDLPSKNPGDGHKTPRRIRFWSNIIDGADATEKM